MCALRNNFAPSHATVYLQNTQDPTAEVANLFLRERAQTVYKFREHSFAGPQEF